MCYIEVKSIKKENYRHMENVSKYVGREDRCVDGFIGATNAYLSMNRSQMAEDILKQMKAAHTFHRQEDSRLGIHVVFNFSPSECNHLTKKQILGIGYDLAEQEFPECITYFAVHDHTDNLHLDMMINTVKVGDGKMYGCNAAGWRKIGNSMSDILRQYVPEEEISDVQVNFNIG